MCSDNPLLVDDVEVKQCPYKVGQADQDAEGEDDKPGERDLRLFKAQTRGRGHGVGPDEPEADPG